MSMEFKLRDIEVFRPYSNEIPEDLLLDHFDEFTAKTGLAAEMVRIAKLGDETLGVYAMDRGDGVTYLLHALAVAPSARKRGLGRWLVGHAIGVAESKGGRHVLVKGNQGGRFLRRIGFVDDPQGMRFDLIPE